MKGAAVGKRTRIGKRPAVCTGVRGSRTVPRQVVTATD